MKSAEQIAALRALIDRADKAAAAASGAWEKAVEDIRREIIYLAGRLNIGGSAADRERVFRAVQRKIATLEGRLDRILRNQMTAAARLGFKSAEQMTGIRIDYSPKREAAILQAVAAEGGESMAAVFTDKMSQNAVGALRSAVVGAFQEQAVAGGTMRDLSRMIRDRWEAAAENEANFRFVDRRGREWETDTYLQMNTRTNSMTVYNDMIADTCARATGSDLVRISDDGRTADSCDACARWAGRIVSLTGATKGFPTLADAREDGMFHPNCIHTLEPVIEEVDGDEIEEQRRKNGGRK